MTSEISGFATRALSSSDIFRSAGLANAARRKRRSFSEGSTSIVNKDGVEIGNYFGPRPAYVGATVVAKDSNHFLVIGGTKDTDSYTLEEAYVGYYGFEAFFDISNADSTDSKYTVVSDAALGADLTGHFTVCMADDQEPDDCESIAAGADLSHASGFDVHVGKTATGTLVTTLSSDYDGDDCHTKCSTTKINLI